VASLFTGTPFAVASVGQRGWSWRRYWLQPRLGVRLYMREFSGLYAP